jgi:hypothetical protein
MTRESEMTTHTRGPWRVEAATINPLTEMPYFHYIVGGAPGSWMGVATTFGEPNEADARLIASAPELLESLCELRDWYGLDPLHLTPLDQWESLAEEFYKETGFLRPGKDMPSAYPWTDEQEEKREATWKEWAAKRRSEMVKRVIAAITKATTP